MFKSRMDNKGQISAEYLLLMVVILIILSAVTIPLVSKSVDASNDVSGTSDAKIAVESIANAANVIYANGVEAKRTVIINIPQSNMKVVTGTNGSKGFVSTNITLSDGTTKTVIAVTEYPLYPRSFTLSKGNRRAVLKWNYGASSIDSWMG